MRREHDDTFFVYMHVSPSKKVYIGITCQEPINRWGGGSCYSRQKHFANAIKKYGWENIEHIILCKGLSKREACTMEKVLIAMYRANDPKYGYNSTDGGEHFKPNEEVLKKLRKPKNLSEETLEKMRERGRELYKKYLAGRRPTREQIEKMAESKRGIKQDRSVVDRRVASLKKYYEEHGGFSAEHRAKLSNAMKGRTPSEETLMRMRAAHAPERNHRSRKVMQLDENGNVIATFVSAREAMRQTGIHYTSIVRACSGVRLKHAGGYRWEYVIEEKQHTETHTQV